MTVPPSDHEYAIAERRRPIVRSVQDTVVDFIAFFANGFDKGAEAGAGLGWIRLAIIE